MTAHRSAGAAVPLLALCMLGILFSASAQAAGGTAEGWGKNISGQVGNGTVTPAATDPCQCIKTPVAVSGLSGATQIAGGSNHTLALLANGTVMAWGLNNVGQLGDGEPGGPEQCGGFGCSPAPIQVPGLANVVAIAAGERFNLALLANGTVMAWGRNDDGQLGDGEFSGPERCGTTACGTVPIQVPGLANVVAIAAGKEHSLALLGDGTVMAWGFDLHGELGDGTGNRGGCECVDRPVPVPGVAGAMAILAGGNSVYALLADGTVKAWGLNTQGQLGVGAISPASGCECLGPVSVSGLAGVKALAAGSNYSLATLSSGSIQAWGLNFFGELGNGNTTPPTVNPCRCIPTPAPVSGLSGPQAIAAGESHSLALLPDGSIEAWGRNSDGQLGDGTANDRALPTAVNGISGASGVFAGEVTSFVLIGPSQTLKVSLAGAGAGEVGGPAGILCPPSCEGRHPQSKVEILRAEPTPGSGFAGFSGPCTGTGPCQVKLDQDQSLTATFGPPKGTAITKATVISRKKTASFSFGAPGAITGFQCELIRPKPHKRHKPKTHRSLKRVAHKPPKPHFSSCQAPIAYKHLGPGRYTFKVRALDILGADADPALKRFAIKRPHRARKPKP